MTWQENAACRDMGPDVFFTDDPAPILELCATCPVRHECLADALAQSREEDYGVRGGVTQGQRRRLSVGVRRRLAANLTGPVRPVVTVQASCLTCDGPLTMVEHEVLGPCESDALLVCADGHENYLSLTLNMAKGA